MMAQAGNIRLEGMDELFRNLDRHGRDAVKSAMQGLTKAGMAIVNDAKANLRDNGSVVTGQLRASGRVVKDGADAIEVGFFGDGRGYAEYVEYGRRAGKMPPVSALVQWAHKKLRLPDKAAKSAGFLMARAIAKKGTRPHPFFVPALEKNRQAIDDAVAEAVRKEVDNG